MAMQKVESAPVILTSNDDRIKYAAASRAASRAPANTPTPDYHLPYSGDQVSMGIQKALDLQPETMGGMKVIPSTATAPANADTQLIAGAFLAYYMTATGFPVEFTGLSPLILYVTVKTGLIVQVLEAQGNRYYRWIKDGGVVWSAFSPKSTNSGSIDTSGEPSPTPTPDPIDGLAAKLATMENKITKMPTIGTTAVGAAIMAGKYDFDTGAIVP